MTQSIGFRFPYDQSDQWDGFNDSGIEHFSGDPYVHLGREVVQNTLDARLEGTSAPAHIMIQVIDVPTSSIPDLPNFRNTLAACRLAAENESEKAQIFFENALELLSKSKIAVLKISDYNTTGVRDPVRMERRILLFSKRQDRVKRIRLLPPDPLGLANTRPSRFLHCGQFL